MLSGVSSKLKTKNLKLRINLHYSFSEKTAKTLHFTLYTLQSWRSQVGFTLIELLIVITIIGLLGIAAFVNFKDLIQNQVIKKAKGEIQTVLRLAQANATSSLLCNGEASVDWKVNIGPDNIIILNCGPSNFPVNTTTLIGAKVKSILGSECSSSLTVTSTSPLIITFFKLSGAVSFARPSEACISASSTVKLEVENTKTQSTEIFTISSGGAINVQ